MSFNLSFRGREQRKRCQRRWKRRWRRQKEKSDADPLEKEIDRLKQENQIKDEKIQRYENWYRNLKAGAIAKKPRESKST